MSSLSIIRRLNICTKTLIMRVYLADLCAVALLKWDKSLETVIHRVLTRLFFLIGS